MRSDTKVSLRALTSACVHLAAGAGALIRGVASPGCAPASLELVSKADDTPQTIADRHAQRHIISGLRAQPAFAGVHIVGEEGGEEADAGWAGAPDADLGLLGAAWAEELDVLVCADDVSVWIDPLDGTKEFTAGRYEFVTTLVGISVRGSPSVGVISEPYALQCAGRLLWGGQAAGGVFELAGPSGETRRLSAPAADSLAARHAAVTSLSRSTGAVDAALTALEASGLVRQRIPAGGAGFKAACCVDGRAAFWLFPRAGTSRWDTCAAQALLEAVGGALVDRAGRQIVYDHRATDHGNHDGVVAVRDRATLAAVLAVTAGLDAAE